MSRFVGFGDKKLGQLQNSFQTQRVEFSFFAPKGHCGASFVLGSAENSRFETQPPFSAQATSCNRKVNQRRWLSSSLQTAGRGASLSVGKVSSLRWLAHELANGP